MIGEISETFCFVCKYTGIRLFLFSARPTILVFCLVLKPYSALTPQALK